MRCTEWSGMRYVELLKSRRAGPRGTSTDPPPEDEEDEDEDEDEDGRAADKKLAEAELLWRQVCVSSHCQICFA